MKSIITVAAMFFAVNTFAQKIKETEVPKAVMTTFQEHFKGAKVEKWEKEESGYEASFDLNKVETSATFSADGKLMETESEIAVKSLPVSVTDYITKNYAGYKIEEAAKIVDDKGAITYEAEVEKGKDEMELMFDANGGFLKKVAKDKEEDDDKD